MHPALARACFWRLLPLALLATFWITTARLSQAQGEPPAPFLPAERCALCHSHSPCATAMLTQSGQDASPFATWAGTVMANAFRDPYWRAQMASEIEAEPEAEHAIESLCFTCHAPLASHGARLAGQAVADLAALEADPLARDGVSCMACHSAHPEGLGTPASYSGKLALASGCCEFGPYPEPFTRPMQMHTGLTPRHGEHISSSALCGACHTLITSAHGSGRDFLEQATYLEWRNSVFSDEGGASAESRTCQSCHMADLGTMRIARMPPGGDFNIAPRPNVRGHAILGANALLLDLLRENAGALGVTAPAATLVALAQATRNQLAQQSARIELESVERTGGELRLELLVENLTGHKLPSGYPARRAWLHLRVEDELGLVYESGAYDAEGRLLGIADEHALPHVDRLARPEDVVVYEMIALDGDGHPTTSLAAMVERGKDTRLLPRGWRPDGPEAARTAPVGIAGDADFLPGSDRVHVAIPLAPDRRGPLAIRAELLYQSIPPAWSDGLRTSRSEPALEFLRMLASRPRSPERLAAWTSTLP